jgi:PIN domain nuclease of toxin-antitoxin system
MPLVRQLKQHKLILDTHVWIWLMGGEPIFNSSFLKVVDHNQSHHNILISAISIWEVGMLVEKKRLELEMDCLDWIEQSLSSPGIKLSPLSPRIAIQSTRLPGNAHGDPADRILIATAHEEGAVLVTCDQKLLEYGKDPFVSVYNPQ